MKFTAAAAVLAIATGAAAWGNETVVTEVVDVYTTFCPAPTEITHGTKTWTVTSSGTFTVTDCSCTITRPVMTTSSVYCPPTSVPGAPAPPANNSTMVTATAPAPTMPAPVPTGAPGGPGPAPTETPAPVPTGGAAALSGAGLAGLVGLAAFIL